MPKGALLHAHLDATVNVNVLLSLALQQPAIYVCVPTPINASTIASTLPRFQALPQDQFSDGAGLTDPSYVANDWVSIRKARETFSPELGGPQGFDKWVLAALTINPNEAYKTHNTVTKVDNRFLTICSLLNCRKQIWQKFTSTFITSTVCFCFYLYIDNSGAGSRVLYRA
jgi:adenosine deaminase CECR1